MKKNIYAFLLSIAGTVLAHNATAQRIKKDDDNTTVVTFHHGGNKAAKRNTTAGENNVIKIAPLGLLSGHFPVYYERRITEFFSVQVGVALTSRNYARTILTDDTGPKNLTEPAGAEDDNEISGPFLDYTYRKAKMGYAYHIEPRFYFNDEAIDGYFLGTAIDWYRYNSSIPEITAFDGNNATYGGAPVNEHENIRDYMIRIGRQTMFNRLSLEVTTDVGVRNVNGARYVAYADYSGGGNATIIDGIATYKQTQFNYNIAFRIGFHF